MYSIQKNYTPDHRISDFLSMISHRSDRLSAGSAAALNMPMLVIFFTSYNPFPLVLKEQKKLCLSYGHVAVGDIYCARREMQFTLWSPKNIILCYCLMTKFDFLDMKSHLLNCQLSYCMYNSWHKPNGVKKQFLSCRRIPLIFFKLRSYGLEIEGQDFCTLSCNEPLSAGEIK